MRRHIIGAFGRMPVRAILWCDVGKEILQITTHVGIGVLLDGKRCGGVLDKQGEKAFLYTLLLAPVHHIPGDIIKPGTVCFRTQSMCYLFHLVRVTKEYPEENLNETRAPRATNSTAIDENPKTTPTGVL